MYIFSEMRCKISNFEFGGGGGPTLFKIIITHRVVSQYLSKPAILVFPHGWFRLHIVIFHLTNWALVHQN